MYNKQPSTKESGFSASYLTRVQVLTLLSLSTRWRCGAGRQDVHAGGQWGSVCVWGGGGGGVNRLVSDIRYQWVSAVISLPGQTQLTEHL